MNSPLPRIYLLRHGETAWSLTGQHTGRTDLPLTERGEQHARRSGERLRGTPFAEVLTSPLQRARRTCELAGLEPPARIDEDLSEWDYGEYEGRRTEDVRQARPGWEIFRDGCPGGEPLAQVAARADRIMLQLRRAPGNVAIFSHGHFLRILAVRWLDLPAIEGRRFILDAGAISILGYAHDNRETPVIVSWNETHHLAP